MGLLESGRTHQFSPAFLAGAAARVSAKMSLPIFTLFETLLSRNQTPDVTTNHILIRQEWRYKAATTRESSRAVAVGNPPG